MNFVGFSKNDRTFSIDFELKKSQSKSLFWCILYGSGRTTYIDSVQHRLVSQPRVELDLERLREFLTNCSDLVKYAQSKYPGTFDLTFQYMSGACGILL